MRISLRQIFIAALWPSFIVAIAATGLFFSAFNPRDLYPFNLDMEITKLGAYTIGFFVFWIICAVSSFITIYFVVTNLKSAELNETSHQQK